MNLREEIKQKTQTETSRPFLGFRPPKNKYKFI